MRTNREQPVSDPTARGSTAGGRVGLRRKTWGARLLAWSLGLAAMGAAAQEPSPLDAWGEGAWRTEAEARIRAHRQVEVELQVLDAEGSPVPAVAVQLDMQSHAFGFGSAVHEPTYLKSSPQDPYRVHLRTLFNTAVLENWMKWGAWEGAGEARAGVDELLRQLSAEGLRLRGHTMVWQCTDYGGTFPRDVERLIAEPPTEASRAALRQRVRDRVLTAGTHFRGIVRDWDVLNETTAWHVLTRYLTPETPQVGSPDLADWIRLARQADSGARLYINEYHILVGDFRGHRDTYEATIRGLLQMGAPLGGIGFQGHYYSGKLVPTPQEVLERLDRFARHGLPLAITEFDTFGGDWGADPKEAEARQAQLLGGMLTLFFSHPAAEQFLMWGFWDGQHWGGCAPLFRKDWSEKPGAAVWRDLVFRRWWTRAARAATGEDGSCRLRVFAGDYEVQLVAADGAKCQARLRVDRLARRHVLRLTRANSAAEP